MRRSRFVLAFVAVALGAGCWSAQASAYIYWGNWAYLNGAIGRANTDGTGINQGFASSAPLNGDATTPAVAVDEQHLYWTTYGYSIGRANLDGSGTNQDFITGANFPEGLAVDGQYVYWSNPNTQNAPSNSIGRANLDGSDANQSFITGLNDPQGVAVDDQYIYWADTGSNSIGRANLDGTDPNQSFITGADDPTAVAVNGQYIYWTNEAASGTIGRANLDGTDPNQSFITGADDPYGVALDSHYVYWSNNVAAGSIGRANLDGTDPNQSFITGLDYPAGLAVDSAPGTATPSSTSLSFGTQPLDTYGAAQQLTVTNTGTGAVELSSVNLSGEDFNDFLITSDSCSGASLVVGATCTIYVRFGPSATGQRSATLTIDSEIPGTPLSIPLAGTGGPLPQGPPGTNGKTGASGPAGPAGQIELVTCKSVTTGKGKHKKTTEKCATKLTSKPIKFKTSERLATASLSRAKTIYAVGTATSTGKHISLELLPLRKLRKGRYTLALTRGHTQRRETVTIA